MPLALRFVALPLVALPLGFCAVVLVWLTDTFWAVGMGFGRDSSAFRFFASPEASLFYWLFGASSLVVGLALAGAQTPKPSNQAMQRTAGRSAF